MKIHYFVALLFVSVFSIEIQANESLVMEPEKDSYQFVSDYRTTINAPAEAVWKHLKNLGSWMYEFDMSHYSGERGKVGQVLKLYSEHDFFVQITSITQNETLVLSHLPNLFKGEYMTGVIVITLNEAQGKTTVNLTMSRRYTWQGDGEDSMKTIRQSSDFLEDTRDTWSGFLGRLQAMAESK